DCISGFCADGVCCNTPCNAGPCDACSVAAGASAAGICTLLTGPACDDGNLCTQLDTCVAGLCTGKNAIVCTPSDDCHTAGICKPASGICSNPIMPDGTTCDDANACTKNDTCSAGVCSAGAPVNCPPPGECYETGLCDPSTGLCNNSFKSDG